MGKKIQNIINVLVDFAIDIGAAIILVVGAIVILFIISFYAV